jgi:glycosyltransferase involved in cell wall biosynthesis
MSESVVGVVPVYGHGKTLPVVLDAFRKHTLPVIVVDDGNEEAARASIRAVCAPYPDVVLVERPQNGGKGAAVLSGILKAQELGYAHAFPIDADAQHDLEKIPFFLKALRKHPEGVICALPFYGADAPKSRLWGRRITNFWVALETLSKDILDAMCGFRIYPISEVSALEKNGFFDLRMGFDIEVLVRLHWLGKRLYFYPVQVQYPEGGHSNFSLIKSNLEIAKTHAILFLSMPWNKLKAKRRNAQHG